MIAKPALVPELRATQCLFSYYSVNNQQIFPVKAKIFAQVRCWFLLRPSSLSHLLQCRCGQLQGLQLVWFIGVSPPMPVHLQTGRAVACAGDVSLPLPAAALTRVFVPIPFPSSEATASSLPSRPPLPAPSPLSTGLSPSSQQLNYRLVDKAPASDLHRIYSGLPVSLLALRC